jgi:hypothetical protein
MKISTRIFNVLLLTSAVILILMSLLALILIHWTLWDYAFSFTPIGINNYLTAFGIYKALFTATVAVIAAYFGILRLTAATDANIQKMKQDRFSDWKTVLDVRFIETEKRDPLMKREFIRIRHNLFEQVYQRNFNLENNDHLNRTFQAVFPQELINFFETQNNVLVGVGAVYPNNNYAFSFDSFQFLFFGCFDIIYNEAREDLLNIYLRQIPGDRHVDGHTHQLALLEYTRHNRQ